MRSEPSTRMRSEPSPISSPACRPTSDHVCLGSFAYLASPLAYRLPYAYRSHQIRLPVASDTPTSNALGWAAFCMHFSIIKNIPVCI